MPRHVVLAFVDYENLRQSLSRNYVEKVGAGRLAATVKEIAEDLGEFRAGWFYGDWTGRQAEAREIEEAGFRAVNVLGTRGGKDRTDVTMALEMNDAFRQRNDVSTFILGTGDSDFAEVVRRARGAGKRIYVCAVGASAARELLAIANGAFFVEARLGLTARSPDMAARAQQLALISPALQWRLLVLRLDSLEKKLPHVVRNYFRDRILEAAFGYGETSEERDGSLDRAIREGIILEFAIPNPKLPGRNVAAIRLNRETDGVKGILVQK